MDKSSIGGVVLAVAGIVAGLLWKGETSARFCSPLPR